MTERNQALVASEESTKAQLELAVRQGEALEAALEAMDEESGSGVHRQREGDFEVAVAVEEAEGMWHVKDGRLEWRDPEDENCHIEVCVRDRADGRFVPGLAVTVTVVRCDGEEIGTHAHPFLWHPWFHHYGRNWRINERGDYDVRVRVEPPEFMRHDHENGRRYTEAVVVDFDGVAIDTGRKIVEREED